MTNFRIQSETNLSTSFSQLEVFNPDPSSARPEVFNLDPSLACPEAHKHIAYVYLNYTDIFFEISMDDGCQREYSFSRGQGYNW